MSNTVKLSKPNRPFSVWLTSGVNMVLAIIVLATSFIGAQLGASTGQAVFWAVLALGTTISAQYSWWGSRWGRNAMLALITIYLGLVLVGAVQEIDAVRGQLNGDATMMRLTLRFVLCLAWLIANYWLLLGKRARMFFA